MSALFKCESIVFIQPALPSYRIDFFDSLYETYGKRLKVYYSPGKLGLLTDPVSRPWAYQVGSLKDVAGIFAWQSGVVNISYGKNDLLVLSGNPRQLSTIFLLLKAKFHKAKIVWWGHYWSSSSKRWRQLLRFIPMSVSDAALFYTDDEVDSFKNDRLAFGKSRLVAALNNGIDDSKIKLLRDNYSSSDRGREVLFIGRLTPKANLGLAIQALSKIGESAPVLHIIGSGEQEEFLRSLVVKLNVSDFVRWHGASTSEEFVSKIANRCRAFVYPGEVGLSLIHAMAYGLPAIVHGEKRAHMPEIAAFEDNVTGLSFPPGDDESLAALLAENIDDFDVLNNLSKNASLKLVNNYTTKSMSARFIHLCNLLNDAG